MDGAAIQVIKKVGKGKQRGTPKRSRRKKVNREGKQKVETRQEAGISVLLTCFPPFCHVRFAFVYLVPVVTCMFITLSLPLLGCFLFSTVSHSLSLSHLYSTCVLPVLNRFSQFTFSTPSLYICFTFFRLVSCVFPPLFCLVSTFTACNDFILQEAFA